MMPYPAQRRAARRHPDPADQGGQPAPRPVENVPLPVVEEPLDPAGQALSDALRMSFRLLKVSMVILVVAYFCSGGGCVQPDEQVVVLRLGRIHGAPLEPGFHFNLPYPIDEKISIPVKQKRSQSIDLFWLRLKDEDKGKELDELRPSGSSLEPVSEGALMTGDYNLMHVLARVTYIVADPIRYVSNVLDEGALIRATAESSLIAVVAGHEVDGILRGQTTDQISNQVRRRMQAVLDRVDSGLLIEIVSIEAKTPPLQVRRAFTDVQRAESEQLEKIEVANARRTQMLNAAAGPSHELVLARIREYEGLRDAAQEERAEELRQEIISILANEASGEAARLINEARSYRENLVQEVDAEVQRFTQLLPEYRKNPTFLVEQLWLDVQKQILSNMSLEKIRLPRGTDEVRILVNRNQAGRQELERQRIAQEAQRGQER
jgi:membrane protease subunit HflK